MASVTTLWTNQPVRGVSSIAVSPVVEVSPGLVSLLIDYTKGTESSVVISMEISDDGTTWYTPVSSSGTDLSVVWVATVSSKYRVLVAGSPSAGSTERLGPLIGPERYIRFLMYGQGSVYGTGRITVKALYHQPPNRFDG